MIRLQLSLFILLFSTTYCTSNVEEQEKIAKFIPDHTPYIAGLLEATYDTVHHFPEVVVGYMSDPLNFYHPDILNNYEEYSNIYNTDLLTQVVKTSQWFGLTYESEATAEVTVTGPIGTPQEKTVKYSAIEQGVYGDIKQKLILIPEGRYMLKVILSDGRKYKATTIIPTKSSIAIPDSIGLKVNYKPYEDGTPREESNQNYFIRFDYPEHSILSVIQSNSNRDRETLLLEPSEKFLFANRGPYLRSGALYAITLSKNFQDSLRRRWGQDLNKSKEKIWQYEHYWMRFSFFSEGIGGNFFPMVNLYTAQEEWSNTMNQQLYDAFDQRDSTYLFDISTILKIDEQDQVLPKDSSDAIGFFGGYFSVYRTTTVYPIRTFDLDSVLSATSE